MRWIALLATLMALVCCSVCLTPNAHAQQCFNGQCFGPQVLYAQPIYQPAPIIIVQKPVQPRTDSPHSDGSVQPGTPLEQTVIFTHDPRLSQCGPHGCYRPQFEPRPCYRGPQCPPVQPGYIQHRRTVGIGLNLSWNSRRSWQ